MNDSAIRLMCLEGSPAAMGTAHGAAHAAAIREYAADRLVRAGDGTNLDRQALLALADACLPAHERYAPDLFAEMCALADAAGISPAEAVVVGGYTDFIDTVRAHARNAPVEDNCTAAIVPDACAAAQGFLAQTWDMHASATPYVVMLQIAPEGFPRAMVFSTSGCLGQIGMNSAGVAIGINNLTAADGKVGVTWPFVVRKALQQTNAADALASILDADLAGGHSFLVFDRSGSGYMVEAMPTVRKVVKLTDAVLVHTNHCLDPEARRVEGARPSLLVESSHRRLDHARTLLARTPLDREDLFAMMRDARAICREPTPESDFETCGAVVMHPASLRMWACQGQPSRNAYAGFHLAAGH